LPITDPLSDGGDCYDLANAEDELGDQFAGAEK
jgi:hypothetical protein